jgi:outer membrane receptor protein involved in Fe transport
VLADGKLELTAGLRYFEDSVGSTEGNVGAQPLLDTDSDFDATTSRVILSWHASSNVATYVSYSEGFRSGFDQFLTAKTILNFPPVEPDRLKNYEIGAKGSLWEGRLTFDSAVFFIDWQDVQQSLSVVLDGLPRAANLNGSSASGIGVEAGISIEPLDNLRFGVDVSWNDLTFDDPVLSAGVVLYDKGDRLNSSPEYTAGAFAEYSFPLGSGGFEGTFSASGNYTAQQEFRTLAGPALYRTLGDSLLIARTQFAIRAPDRWTASIYVDNLGDERGTPILAPYGMPDWSVRPVPRTYGLQLEYQF